MSIKIIGTGLGRTGTKSLKLAIEHLYVHTLRDSENWYASVRETIYRGKPQNAKDILRMIYNMIRSTEFRQVAPVFQYSDQLIWNTAL